MEPHEISALLNTDMAEMLKAMNNGDMMLARELLEDLMTKLLVDREEAVVVNLKNIKKLKDVEDKIAETEEKVVNLKSSIRHPKGKK